MNKEKKVLGSGEYTFVNIIARVLHEKGIDPNLASDIYEALKKEGIFMDLSTAAKKSRGFDKNWQPIESSPPASALIPQAG